MSIVCNYHRWAVCPYVALRGMVVSCTIKPEVLPCVHQLCSRVSFTLVLHSGSSPSPSELANYAKDIQSYFYLTFMLYGHKQAREQCSPTCVGLSQACPNKYVKEETFENMTPRPPSFFDNKQKCGEKQRPGNVNVVWWMWDDVGGTGIASKPKLVSL